MIQWLSNRFPFCLDEGNSQFTIHMMIFLTSRPKNNQDHTFECSEVWKSRWVEIQTALREQRDKMSDLNKKRKERSSGGSGGGKDGRDARDGNGNNKGTKRAKVCALVHLVSWPIHVWRESEKGITSDGRGRERDGFGLGIHSWIEKPRSFDRVKTTLTKSIEGFCADKASHTRGRCLFSGHG